MRYKNFDSLVCEKKVKKIIHRPDKTLQLKKKKDYMP